jgi:hypothetical protein
MKIIDIGMCVDNKDPLHIGRIRLNKFSDQNGVVEGAYNIDEKDKWSKKDLFVASPFLPSNVNFIPEEQQAVKILCYNTEKDNVNMEYVAGPFTTMHDFNGQTHTGQLQNTSYGGPIQSGVSIIDKLGNFTNKKSNGSFAKREHFGVYGKYGSDVIFTEDGVMIRGGKFLSKKSASNNQKTTMSDQPLMSDKSSNFYLKKFPTTKKWETVDTTETTLQTGDLKYLIEYELTDLTLSGETQIDIYIYKLKPDISKIYRIENPNLSSVPLIPDYHTLVTNIGSNNSVTVSSSSGTTISAIITTTNISDAYRTTKYILESLHTYGLTQDYEYVNNTRNNFNVLGDLHPFYFRPTKAFQERTCNTIESDNRQTFIKNIDFFGIKQNGLSFSKNKITPLPTTNKVMKEILKESPGEQTFSALKADQIYFITTDPSQSTGDDINPNNLDKYELTQENYLKDIYPFTYSTVRGETLLEVLQAMYKLFVTHKHDILEPLEQSDSSFEELKKKIETLEQDMLNKTIRIN